MMVQMSATPKNIEENYKMAAIKSLSRMISLAVDVNASENETGNKNNKHTSQATSKNTHAHINKLRKKKTPIGIHLLTQKMYKIKLQFHCIFFLSIEIAYFSK